MRNQLSAPGIVSWAATPSIFKTLKYFLAFLKKPRHKNEVTVPKEKRLQVLLHLILTEVTIKTLFLATVVCLFNLLDINLFQVNLQNVTGNKPFYLVLLLVVLYGPLREELIFRLPLVYSRRFMLIALAAFLASYAPLIMQETSLGSFHYAAAALAFCGFAAAFLLSPRLHSCIRQPWRTDYTSLFHLMTVVSALQYLVNYPYINLPLVMLPVLVLLQWIEGLFLGYTRLHLGFKWSLMQHIVNKCLLLIVFFSFYSTP
ncbi:hypothetical protein ACFSRY_13675 [Pontibacter locisalis]|uniref:CAAX protease self-immunity n=1 Tax=Pontibacter locisalis TaxID=1719035 RepID=A0ABW5IMZ2_9BACT